MAELFAQHEEDIVTLNAENCLVVIGSYTGSSDLTTDKTNADAVLNALFPGRFKEAATVNASANTATLTGGAFNSELVPLVYKNDILLDEADYSFVAGTGVFSAFSPALTGGDTVTVTLAKFVYGVNAVEPVADFPVEVKDVKAFGTTAYVYRTTSYGDSKYSINVKGIYDARSLRRKYAANELQKALYGSQWDETSDAENAIERNSNPFVAALIWWYPDATTGDLTIEKVIFYKCTLNKGIFPKPDGTDNAASFEVDASSLYAYNVKTLA